ncbi:MAG: choice-of-anchor D domain-containing protein [Myxococcota bacterium]|nr:choice-of-anchor D domain-containing protein [Myxococcota bacterium]
MSLISRKRMTFAVSLATIEKVIAVRGLIVERNQVFLCGMVLWIFAGCVPGSGETARPTEQRSGGDGSAGAPARRGGSMAIVTAGDVADTSAGGGNRGGGDAAGVWMGGSDAVVVGGVEAMDGGVRPDVGGTAGDVTGGVNHAGGRTGGGVARGGLDGGGVGPYEITPSVLNFTTPDLGQMTERSLRIRNLGPTELRLSDFRWDLSTDFSLFVYRIDDDDVGEQIFIDGEQNQLVEIVIPANTRVTLSVRFQPSGEVQNESGTLQLTATEQNGDLTEVEIPINVESERPALIVTPMTLDFGQVAVGETMSQRLTLTNPSDLPVDLLDMLLTSASGRFRAFFEGQDISIDPGAIPATVNGGESIAFDIVFSPENQRADTANLTIISNAMPPRIDVAIAANRAAPCMRISPAEITFPFGLVNRPTETQLTIESCGGLPLRIDRLDISAGADTFSISPETMPDLPLVLPAADVNMNPLMRPNHVLGIVFNPADELSYRGVLSITHNDVNQRLDNEEGQPVRAVPLTGRGVAMNACPEARTSVNELVVGPLYVVLIDVSVSIDVDGLNGRPVQYEWVVIQRPLGSTSQPVESIANPVEPAEGGPADNRQTPGAQFFVDLVGEYILELQVTDALGLRSPSPSCPQPAARVRITAESDAAIYLQLVWDTPRDDDPQDLNGTDMDLHFLHPAGDDWFGGSAGRYDCYYENVSPDWGVRNNRMDDPSLDIDDTNGAGPESISLNHPQNTDVIGGPYRVGVHYYRATLGAFDAREVASEATIRIHLNQVLSYERSITLNQRNDFWEAAAIIWRPGDRRVIEVNQLSFKQPDGL